MPNHSLFHLDKISIYRACVRKYVDLDHISPDTAKRKVRAHTAGAVALAVRRQPPAPPSEREHARGRRRRGARRPNHGSASEAGRRALEPRPASCGVRGGGLASLLLRAEKPPWGTGNGRRISSTGAEAGTATRPNLLARQSARNQKRFERSIRTHAREDRSGVNGG